MAALAHLDWHRLRLWGRHRAIASATIDHRRPCCQRYLRSTIVLTFEQVCYVKLMMTGGWGRWGRSGRALGAANVGNVKLDESSIRLLTLASKAVQWLQRVYPLP